MSEIIMIKGRVLIDVADINDVRGLEYQGNAEDALTGKFVVRVFSKTPFIDIVCDSLTEAQNTYRNIQKSRPVVNLNEMRFGK